MLTPHEHLRVKSRVYIDGVLKGESKWGNLITDQFGTWLAGFFRTPSSGNILQVTMAADDGADDSLCIYFDGAADNRLFNESTSSAVSIGSQIKVGSGSTAPARDDTNIETAFGTAPESGAFDTGTGSYSAGNITVSGSITAGGAGTINETGFFGAWRVYNTDNQALYLLFHDAISPGVPFVAGQSITDEYVVAL